MYTLNTKFHLNLFNSVGVKSEDRWVGNTSPLRSSSAKQVRCCVRFQDRSSYTLLQCIKQHSPHATVSHCPFVGCNYEINLQNALYRLIYYSKSALHASGDVFAHHQEHLTVFIVSGSVQPSCCQLRIETECHSARCTIHTPT